MAVKNLKMLNLVCERKNLENIIKDLVLKENCQFVNSYMEIENKDFAIGVTEEHADEILNMENIQPIKPEREIREYLDKLDNLSKNLGYKPTKSREYIDDDVDFKKTKKNINNIIEKMEEFNSKIKALEEKIKNIERLEFIEKVKSYDINLKNLMKMEYFSVKIGYLSKEKRKRISRNYENISAVVIHLGTQEEKELYLIISPKTLDVEMNRILRSTNFKETKIQEEYLNSQENIEEVLAKDKKNLNERLNSTKEKFEEYLDQNKKTIDELYSKLSMYIKIDVIKEKIGASDNYAYISAWTPLVSNNDLESLEEKYDNILIKFKDENEVMDKIEKPTYMKNNKFFEPFAQLVTMYGVPSSNEIDPTSFFGLAYTFLFGAMFGDLGQGFVISFIGLYLSKKKDMIFGGILTRIGIGSMIFGIFYDSFFGYENIISQYLPFQIYIRPMENINNILVLSLAVGFVLLTISYIYSIANKLRNKDIVELYFGKNGINGLILFWDIVAIVIGLYMGDFLINKYFLYTLLLISASLILLKDPLSNIISKNNIDTQINREYYIESGFNIFETILSLFSNSISFIRVGAFAITHVGLFLAFHTLANIVGSISGNITMFFLGNIIIIGLEGLIVFIQGLRLLYYELFSKYYSGDGTLFSPEKFKEV
ncbi:MAG: V-type ATP synthase subunit I [bacterium]